MRRARGDGADRLAAALSEAADRAAQKRFADGTERLRRRLERAEVKKVEAMWRGLAERVVAAAASKGGLLVEADATQAETARVNAIAKAANLPKFAKDKVGPWIEKLYESVWLGTYSVAQDHLTTTQQDAIRKRVLAEGGRRLGLIDISDDVKSALFRVLEFSREWEAGQPSPRQVARWIRSEVPAGRFVHAGPRYRAQLIARTEILHSTRMSQLELAKADPYVKTVTAMDGDYDEICADRDGTEFTLADADVEMLATHPNCVLSFVPSYQTTSTGV